MQVTHERCRSSKMNFKVSSILLATGLLPLQRIQGMLEVFLEVKSAETDAK